ncbi:hypothetical protein QFC22_004592 [Naganishia vaughanmartiniae]|uniref:Uncharacterized protein n=1 Tax=Naganishia vaughanmartiniae TaxID=1424756 RepID=A0ACC2WYQ0_9TREE|nr:hypothetical protein QFC22_004592 [Naganishia vaughanmartiniae]
MTNNQEPSEAGVEKPPVEQKKTKNDAPRLSRRDRLLLAAVVRGNGSKQENESAVAVVSDEEEGSTDEAGSFNQNEERTTNSGKMQDESTCIIPDAIRTSLEWDPDDKKCTLTPRTTFVSNQFCDGEEASGNGWLCDVM